MRQPPSPAVPRRHITLRRAGRRVPAVLAALGAVAALVVAAAGPAVAGGPTSVLAVDYEGTRAGAALVGSHDYESLWTALDAGSEPTGDPRGPAGFMDSQVRLTWLIHDVTPWRVDALAIDGDDVWVTTATSHDGSSLFEQPAVVHRAADPALLLGTLRSLGAVGARVDAAGERDERPVVGFTEADRVSPSGGV